MSNEGPFHHFWVLGDTAQISFSAQGQADYAVEIGQYRQKGVGLSGRDTIATTWIVLGLASALWIAFHSARFMPQQSWIMRLTWPQLTLMIGPFGILFYMLAYCRPVLRHSDLIM